MERLIGRKKIEEIRDSQKVSLMEVEGVRTMVPNFFFENKMCYMKSVTSFTEELSHDNALVSLLNFINDYVPAAKFEYSVRKDTTGKSSSFEKLLNIYFGNIKMKITMPADYKELNQIEVWAYEKNTRVKKFAGDLERFNTFQFKKANYFRESSEYQTLEEHLRSLYNIKETT